MFGSIVKLNEIQLSVTCRNTEPATFGKAANKTQRTHRLDRTELVESHPGGEVQIYISDQMLSKRTP